MRKGGVLLCAGAVGLLLTPLGAASRPVGAGTAGSGAATDARAWTGAGHEVIARIAWNDLGRTAATRAVRNEAVDLLLDAPEDARLDSIYLSFPAETRRRDFFVRTAVWADWVRSRAESTPALRKYNHRTWHRIEWFWRAGAPGPRTNPTLSSAKAPNAVERLNVFVNALRNGTGTRAERAVQLAWVFHMLGEIHQPLHTATRIDGWHPDPVGDRRGQLFRLNPRTANGCVTPGTGDAGQPVALHGFWDSAITRKHPRNSGEARTAYIQRLAGRVTANQAKDTRTLRIGFERWAVESHNLARDSVYARVLECQFPTDTYRNLTYRIAERRVALAGYRLAATLEYIFGN